MKLVCLELSFDAAGRSAADNLARPNYCAIEIHFSIGDRTIRGEKQISIRALSLSLYLSTCIYIYIFSFIRVSRAVRSDPIYKQRIETRNATPYEANTRRCVGRTCRGEKRVSEAKFKYFSADGTTPACSATLENSFRFVSAFAGREI